MTNTLFHFGDSFSDNINGSGTSKLFSEYVADSLCLSYENYSWGGQNNELILHSLLINLDRIKPGDVVFINYSFPNRFLLSVRPNTPITPQSNLENYSHLIGKKFITSANADSLILSIFDFDKNLYTLDSADLIEAASYLHKHHQSKVVDEYFDSVGKLLIDRGCKPYIIYNSELDSKLKNWKEIKFEKSYYYYLEMNNYLSSEPNAVAHCKPEVHSLIAEYIKTKL